MDAIRILWSSRGTRGRSIFGMEHTAIEEMRTLTVVLPEADWRALRAAEPDAVGWIQQQIRSRLATRGPQTAEQGSADIDDDY